MTEITQYMEDGAGHRACSFDAGEVRVLVRTSGNATNDAVHDFAVKLARASDAILELEARVERQAAIIDRLKADRDAATDRVAASIDGKRRFFDEVVMRPEKAAQWSGTVLLMDPARMERGRALWFASIRDVRLAHPELWPVGTNEHGDIILDAWGHR